MREGTGRRHGDTQSLSGDKGGGRQSLSDENPKKLQNLTRKPLPVPDLAILKQPGEVTGTIDDAYHDDSEIALFVNYRPTFVPTVSLPVR